MKTARRMGVNIWTYKPDNELKAVIAKSSHNNAFRQGFWNYSIMRLFAVLDYSISHPSKFLLHLESDISIFQNFPFNRLAESQLPAWFKFNESHDVASIFVIPGPKDAQWLRGQFLNELKINPALTDMTLLSSVARNNPNQIEYLPIARRENDILIRVSDRNSMGARLVSDKYKDFEGVFDSAPMGMWLLGQDPRNHFGKIIRYRALPESLVQPEEAKFKFNDKSNILTLEDGTPIFNLHVHSKELRYFDKQKSKSISRKVEEAMSRSHPSRVSLLALKYLLVDFIKRNGIFLIPRRLIEELRGRP